MSAELRSIIDSELMLYLPPGSRHHLSSELYGPLIVDVLEKNKGANLTYWNGTNWVSGDEAKLNPGDSHQLSRGGILFGSF